MRKFLLVLAAVTLSSEGPSAGSQVVSLISEPAGMYSCTCSDGRNAGPVDSPMTAMAWQTENSLNSRIASLNARIGSCLSAAAQDPGSAKARQCSSMRSEEASLRSQLARAQSQKRGGSTMAQAQCLAACAASPPRPSASSAPPTAQPSSSSSSSTRGGSVPVGNDWSLDNTISGQNPITGLSEIQRKWEEDKQKTLRAFKAIGRSPKTAGAAASTTESPATTTPVTGFKPLKPATPPATPKPSTAQDPQTDVDPDLAAAIASELVGDSTGMSETKRLAAIQQIAPQLRASLPPELMTQFTNAARGWALFPNRAQNKAWDELETLRLKAIGVISDRRPRTATDLLLFMRFHDPVFFEKVLVPAAASLSKRGGGL